MKVVGSSGRTFEIVAAKNVPLSNGQRETLKALHAFAEKGINDPSFGQIAKLVGINVRTVQRSVKAMESRGFIRVGERVSWAGFKLSHSYQITPDGTEALSAVLRMGELVEQIGAAPERAPVSESEGLTFACAKEGAASRDPCVDVVVVKKQLQVTKQLSESDQQVAKDMLADLPSDLAQQILDELQQKMSQGDVRMPMSYLFGLKRAALTGNYRPVLAAKGARLREMSGPKRQG